MELELRQLGPGTKLRSWETKVLLMAKPSSQLLIFLQGRITLKYLSFTHIQCIDELSKAELRGLALLLGSTTLLCCVMYRIQDVHTLGKSCTFE